MNTIDHDFFAENIRFGYEQRKVRHFDKNEQPIEMDQFLYDLIKGSNQIVHNRGKALSYLTGDRKRKEPGSRKKPHQYELNSDVRQHE